MKLEQLDMALVLMEHLELRSVMSQTWRQFVDFVGGSDGNDRKLVCSRGE